MSSFLPNFITLMRLPLAFLFLQDNGIYRAVALLLAMATDALDGFIARRYGGTSKIGTLLDPVMDKLFVLFVLTIFLKEDRLNIWEAATMMSRDFAVMLFGCYLAFKGFLSTYKFQAFWFGKITTMCQFSLLLGLTFDFRFPFYVFAAFILLGFFALGELYLTLKSAKRSQLRTINTEY